MPGPRSTTSTSIPRPPTPSSGVKITRPLVAYLMTLRASSATTVMMPFLPRTSKPDRTATSPAAITAAVTSDSPWR
jgi:hypothetical protein